VGRRAAATCWQRAHVHARRTARAALLRTADGVLQRAALVAMDRGGRLRGIRAVEVAEELVD
jgi:hypothetical protein